MARPKYRRTTVKAKAKKPRRSKAGIVTRNGTIVGGKVVGGLQRAVNDLLEVDINLWKRKRRGK